MLLFAADSGLAGLWADAREFVAAVRFARPGLLWLLLLPPALALADWWAARLRRAAIARVGRPGAVAGQLTGRTGRRWWGGLAHSLAWAALVLGLAGPRWGRGDETGVAVGRDVVLVLDMSRTMQADDMADPTAPTRWEAARNAAVDLIDAMARRGGHRVAVVLFAARPYLLCPLTTDYDHARAVVREIDGQFPPPEVRPPPGAVVRSGTRIGAALVAAVKAHDKRFPGYQDVILISDGDDPGEDREWVRGADAARQASIPVHAVGVGDPGADAILPIGEVSRLQEAPLEQIAAETRGQYLAARKAAPQLGEFFRTHVEPLPSRDVSDETLPLPKERYAWFLAPALALFVLGWLRGR